MPHIHLKIAAGQSEENKQKLVDLFTKVITENTENPDEAVSVAIEDIPKEDWKDAVRFTIKRSNPISNRSTKSRVIHLMNRQY